MNGRRLPDFHQGDEWPRMEEGDYMLCPDSAREPGEVFLRAPGEGIGRISPKIHKITVNEDATITVSPSIFFNAPTGWHGYLERGVWRQC